MMQLVLVVLAIALAALLCAGGINYLSTDLGLRIKTSQALRVQRDAISHAVSSYKTANNGYLPPIDGGSRMEKLKGYLPGGSVPRFPRGGDPFEWEMTDEGLCLEKNTEESLPEGIVQGVIFFANGAAKRDPGKVSYGTDCVSASTNVDDATSPLTATFINAGAAAILIKGF